MKWPRSTYKYNVDVKLMFDKSKKELKKLKKMGKELGLDRHIIVKSMTCYIYMKVTNWKNTKDSTLKTRLTACLYYAMRIGKQKKYTQEALSKKFKVALTTLRKYYKDIEGEYDSNNNKF
jgi:transcription initiation factor TFIIIB Brf1 subunit/transcription initiation factor TFIIB